MDRFAHVSALRPVKAPRRAASELPLEADRLGELLGAVAQRNRYGEHLVVRQWHTEPEACEVNPDVLRLLAPDAPEEAADPERWLFLDTETTGLAGGTGTYAFLVGVAWWDAGGLQVEQFFMRDHSEEHSLLLALAERMAERRVLVTFNGKSFDWPLLETRYRMTRQIRARTPHAHLDLLHPARQLWRLRLESLRLSELERHILADGKRLAWDRNSDIPSHLIPQIYFDYLRGGAAEPVAAVFRHNAMDLRGLAALAGKMLALVDSACHSERDDACAIGDALELYGISRLLYGRGEHTRARQLYERALGAGLSGAVSRAARRELAQLAKRERDYPRAIELWQELTGAVGASCSSPAEAVAGDAETHEALGGWAFRPDNQGAKRSGALAPEAINLSGAEARAWKPRSVSELKLRPPKEDTIVSRDALDAFEELAIYYEHHAREPERAAELTREALGELRRAVLTGDLDPRRYQRLKARLDHRLARL